MRNSIPATFKPSGGIVTPPTAPDPLETVLRSAFDQGEPCDANGNPTVEDRTITYPLNNGGVLVEECPTWCVLDHAGDIEKLGFAEDLVHEGAPVSISFTVDGGGEASLLSGYISQYPHATDNNTRTPFMALHPDAGMGEALGYLGPDGVEAEIRRVEAHLRALRGLNEQLREARSTYWEQAAQDPARLTANDVKTLPVAVLLEAFDLTVVEIESIPYGIQGVVDCTGEMSPKPVIVLLRSLPQSAREPLVRQLLVSMVEGQA
ncbi:DUF6907 domain-containing protein [Streptomyces halstedii]|uniref:DUF6907 domain-containing protein n=1 Tax=Streptomyces halstedii TaxID=1944 RepID=UPI00382BB0B6